MEKISWTYKRSRKKKLKWYLIYCNECKLYWVDIWINRDKIKCPNCGTLFHLKELEKKE